MMPAMAPVCGPSKSEVIAILRGPDAAARLPITLAPAGAPEAIVDRLGEAWVVRALEKNREAAEAAYQQAKASGDMWWPEMEWRFLEPGEVLLSAAGAVELADAIDKWTRPLFRDP